MSFNALRRTAIVSLVVASSIISGCATIVSGSDQAVYVNTVPNSAVVKLNNINVGNTPTRFDLSRKNKVAVVELALPGYKTKEIELKRGTNGWVWGNILVGGLIGVVVDVSTGAMYSHKLVDDGVAVEVPAAGVKPDDADIWINLVLEPQPALTQIGQLSPLG